MIRLIITFLLMTSVVTAEDLPALYDVAGVTAGDTLNIRRGPDFSTQAFDALTADRTRVEVIERSGDWLRINTAEQSGWVAARYMTPHQGAPASLACFGTEPFWDMTKTVNGPFRLRILDDYRMAFLETGPMTSANDTRVTSSVGTGNPGKLWTVQRKQMCSDGMSDRVYGIAIDLLVLRQTTDGDGHQLYSGCCSLR